MVGFASTTILITRITHKPVYQNNSFPVILLSGYNSPFNGWLRFTHFDLPNYPFIRIIPLTAILLNKVFPSETKREKLPKAPRQAQCQSPFNANSAQEISALQRHPYNYPRRIQNAITAYTDGSKWHPWCPVLSQNVGKQRGTKFTDPFATSCESYPCCSALYQGIKKELSSTH